MILWGCIITSAFYAFFQQQRRFIRIRRVADNVLCMISNEHHKAKILAAISYHGAAPGITDNERVTRLRECLDLLKKKKVNGREQNHLYLIYKAVLSHDGLGRRFRLSDEVQYRRSIGPLGSDACQRGGLSQSFSRMVWPVCRNSDGDAKWDIVNFHHRFQHGVRVIPQLLEIAADQVYRRDFAILGQLGAGILELL